MKARSELLDDELRLVLEDVERELETSVRELAFAEDRGAFVRTFASSSPYAGAAAQRFPDVAPEMVRQAAGLRPVPWETALETVLARTGVSGVRWWLTGSAALAVRGLPIVPRDLDIITNAAGGVQLAHDLRDHLVEPLADGGALGIWWGRAFGEARVEWVGEVHATIDTGQPTDFGPAAERRLEHIRWHGHRLLVPPLELQLEVSERRGLADRAQIIREALA